MTDVAVALDAPFDVARPRRAPAGAVLVSSATVTAGVLAYAFHVLAARTLGADTYGLVAALWAALFLAVVVLYRPLEQTTSRAIADRVARGEEIASVVRSVTLIYALLTALVVTVGAVCWEPLRMKLFLGHSGFAAALLVGTAVYGAAYVVRGICGGLHWFEGYSLGLLSDGAIRLAALLPVITYAAGWVAAAAIAAAAFGGAVVPVLFGRRHFAQLLAPGAGSRFRFGAALAFAGPAAAIAGADQVLVNGGPLFVMLSGGAGAGKVAGVVFAATMIVRIPVFIFTGLAASLLPNLTRLNASGDADEMRRVVRSSLYLFAAVGAVIVALGATAGPGVLTLVYGPDFQAGHLALGLLGVAAGGYLAAATLAQALLALDRGRTAAAIWCAAAGLFVGGYFILPGEPLPRIALTTAVAMVATAIGSAYALLRRDSRAER